MKVLKIIVTIVLILGVGLLLVLVLQNFGIIKGMKTQASGFQTPGSAGMMKQQGQAVAEGALRQNAQSSQAGLKAQQDLSGSRGAVRQSGASGQPGGPQDGAAFRDASRANALGGQSGPQGASNPGGTSRQDGFSRRPGTEGAAGRNAPADRMNTQTESGDKASGTAQSAGNAGRFDMRQANTQAARIYAVSTIPASRGTVKDYIKLNGDVGVKSSVDAVSDKAGRLSRLYVGIGTKVSKGDIIADVDPSVSGNQAAPIPVRAPISGTVTGLKANVGQMVSSGVSILTIAAVLDVEVKAYVPERYLGKIRTQSEAFVSFDAYPGTEFKFRVTGISPVVDPVSRTMEVRLEPLIPDPRIKAGMFARVVLITEIRNNAVIIPTDCLVKRGDAYQVFIVGEDSTAHVRTVTVGLQVDGTAEIVSGLRQGEEVVAAGSTLLDDGARVNVVQRLEGLKGRIDQASAVRTAFAEIGDIDMYLRTNGVVMSRTSVDVLADVAGKVVKLPVSLGDRVEQGQVIAEVDPSKPGMQYVANKVVAPISGVVSSLSVQIGSSVTSANVPLMKISGTDDLQIKAEVAERDLSLISVGQYAEFVLDAYPDLRFQAVLSEIGPEVKSSTQTVEIRVNPTRKDERIKPGMFASIGVLYAEAKNAVKIPTSALFDQNGKQYVYVIKKDSTAELRQVTAGLKTETYAEIRSGLSRGEEVVILGQSLIRNGAKVDVLERSSGIQEKGGPREASR